MSGAHVDAVVTHIVLFPYRGERPVLPWRENRTWLPEGEVRPGESAEDAIRRIALEQAGIENPTSTHLGHFRCRATVYQSELEPGALTFRAVYGVDVGGLADFPADGKFERRIVLQRELMHLIRDRYFEHYKEYTEALDKFVIQRAKERAGSA